MTDNVKKSIVEFDEFLQTTLKKLTGAAMHAALASVGAYDPVDAEARRIIQNMFDDGRVDRLRELCARSSALREKVMKTETPDYEFEFDVLTEYQQAITDYTNLRDAFLKDNARVEFLARNKSPAKTGKSS